MFETSKLTAQRCKTRNQDSSSLVAELSCLSTALNTPTTAATTSLHTNSVRKYQKLLKLQTPACAAKVRLQRARRESVSGSEFAQSVCRKPLDLERGISYKVAACTFTPTGVSCFSRPHQRDVFSDDRVSPETLPGGLQAVTWASFEHNRTRSSCNGELTAFRLQHELVINRASLRSCARAVRRFRTFVRGHP